jgi:phage protein D
MAATGVTSKEKVGSVDVLVDGAALDQSFRDLLHEVKVVDSLTLPDMCLIRITDKHGDKIDTQPLQLGKMLEVKMGAQAARATTSVFKGQIASVEPEFTPTGCNIQIRAYDNSHKLNRERKTRTFQQMSASDMVQKVAREAGLQAKAESTSTVHEFFQQSNETDWDFCWRLALMEDYEVVVEDKTLNFRPANKANGTPTSLRFGDTLTTFRPRMSGIQQVNTVEVRGWDPKAKKVVNGTASSPQTTSAPGVTRSQVASSIGGGTTAVKDRSITTAAQADAIAKSTLQRMADAYFEAEGTALGNPALKAGSKIKVEGVGQKFGGEFTISSSTHHYRGASGYQTHFQIAGRSSRTLTELIRPPDKRDWATSGLVVGIVTNNNDPEQRGRVRVKYPSLSDSEESAWAPVATMSSGNQRGTLMLPQVDEEVVIGFEHGDARRPIVLGSTFNGKDKPGQELLQNRDGSFAVVSNEKIHQHSKKDFEIKSDENMVIEITQDETITTKGKHSHQITGASQTKAESIQVQAGTTVTIKGASINVEASGVLTLKGATVNIQGSAAVNVSGALINLG